MSGVAASPVAAALVASAPVAATPRGAAYGWLITTDHLAEGGQRSDAGTVGPWGIAPAVEARLQGGEGTAFRMLDDEGEVYYSGRLLVVEPRRVTELEPLEDFGMPNAGCTAIQYRDARTGAWTTL